jgi:hypothetical protein
VTSPKALPWNLSGSYRRDNPPRALNLGLPYVTILPAVMRVETAFVHLEGLGQRVCG